MFTFFKIKINHRHYYIEQKIFQTFFSNINYFKLSHCIKSLYYYKFRYKRLSFLKEMVAHTLKNTLWIYYKSTHTLKQQKPKRHSRKWEGKYQQHIHLTPICNSLKLYKIIDTTGRKELIQKFDNVFSKLRSRSIKLISTFWVMEHVF